MHVNADHLVELFYSESQLFDREGRLFVRAESKQAIARHYQKCICRLRGNLLLIADVSSSHSISEESICLIVLNNFEIKLCEESKNYEFCIHLNLKSAQFLEKYYFICNSRSERDKWIESIYLASFNFLKSIYRTLCDDYEKKQEREITPNSVSQSAENVQSNRLNQSNGFLVIRCDNLLCTPTIDPFVCVKVFYRRLYIDLCWHYLGSTEVIQSKSPQFNCAINLPLLELAIFELKFELYHVLEQEFDTSFLSAFTYFQFPRALTCHNCCFALHLFSLDNSHSNGSLSFTLFGNRLKSKLRKRLSLKEFCLQRKNFALQLKPINRQASQSLPNLVMNTENEFHNAVNSSEFNVFSNPITKSFSFKAYSNSADLILEEYMAESKFVFLIPQILMKLYSQDEEKLVTLFEKFSRDNHLLQSTFFEPALHFHHRILRLIKDSLGQIIHFMSRHSFRSSKQKKEAFLQFIPVNFHKQTCCSRTFDASKSSSFTVFSTGAYACHHLGYEKCGMKSILTAKNEYPKVIDCWTMLKKLLTVQHCETKINSNLDLIDNAEGDTLDLSQIEPLYKVICALSEQLSDLVSVHEVDELLSYLNVLSTGKINIFDDEFQLEPIELVYLNIKACLVAINHRISQQQIAKADFDSCNRKLRAAVESLRKIVFACYLSLFSQLSKDQADSLYRLRFRHLSLCTQALTTLIIFIMDRIGQSTFVQQIYQTRYILLQHETLLSCYSDELGMLEDMSYALEEVANTVSIHFTFDAHRPPTLMPDIDTFGDKIYLNFHLDQTFSQNKIVHFQCKIMSLIFNIGVNEQATLAEKLGYNHFQNDLNQVNFHKLKAFVSQFYSDNGRAFSLINQLKVEINRTTTKNIRILYLVQEIVREVKGIRVTCCKSAKDRTGMSITLEEVRSFFSLFHLSEDKNAHLFQTMLDTLRRDGVRIENALKNIGTRKYAFNRIQLVTFPSKFKPPSGTYSTLET